MTNPVRLVQLTDFHLYAEVGKALLGVPTEQSFLETLAQARRDHWPVDAVLATGDLVHDGSVAGYRRLHTHLATLGVPVHCLPGNHDAPAVMREHLAGATVQLEACVDLGAWRIVLLDTTVRGSEGGHLGDAELAHLDQHLAAAPERHALICLHHNPLPVGSPWLDTMRVDNGDALFAVLDRHPQVRAVLWGHVHQTFDEVRRGVRLLATPSTCIQFQPRSTAFALDAVAPGYRWLELRADGGLDTGVARLAGFAAVLDTQAGGY